MDIYFNPTSPESYVILGYAATQYYAYFNEYAQYKDFLNNKDQKDEIFMFKKEFYTALNCATNAIYISLCRLANGNKGFLE